VAAVTQGYVPVTEKDPKTGQDVVLNKLVLEVLLFDVDGKIVQRTQGKPRPWSNPADLGVVTAFDLDGDGYDEILYLDGEKLRATSGGLDKVLWEWTLPSGYAGIWRVLPGGDERAAPVVLVQASTVNPDTQVTEQVIYGIDGKTGKTLFATKELLNPAYPWLLNVSVDGPGGAPRAIFQKGDALVCRPLLFPDRALAPEVVSRYDVRSLRPLPWNGGRAESAYVWAEGVILLLVGANLWFPVQRRRWWALSAVAALYLVLPCLVALFQYIDDRQPGAAYAWSQWPSVFFVIGAVQIGVTSVVVLALALIVLLPRIPGRYAWLLLLLGPLPWLVWYVVRRRHDRASNQSTAIMKS
jgi:hypothetical protein